MPNASLPSPISPTVGREPKSATDRDEILPLETPGVLRYIWIIGDTEILMERFDDGRVLVNGDLVEPIAQTLANMAGMTAPPTEPNSE